MSERKQVFDNFTKAHGVKMDKNLDDYEMGKQWLGGAWQDTLIKKKRETVTPSTDSTSSNPTPDNSASKDLRSIEKDLLRGEASIVPETKIKSRGTIELDGLGKYVSGLYYVEQVKRTWGADGFSQTLELSRNALGQSIKKGLIPQAKPKELTNEYSDRDIVSPNVEKRIHIVVSGDTLFKIATKYYGNGNLFTKIASANNIKEKDYGKIQVGARLIIP